MSHLVSYVYEALKSSPGDLRGLLRKARAEGEDLNAEVWFEVNGQSSFESCLHLASRTSNLQAVRCLLEAGANPLILDGFSRAAVQVASGPNRVEIVDLLVRVSHSAAAPFARSRRSDSLVPRLIYDLILDLSRRSCRLSAGMLSAITAAGGDLNILQSTSAGHESCLHLAARLGDMLSVRLLLQAGASPKTLNSIGATPLDTCRSSSASAEVEALLLSAVETRGRRSFPSGRQSISAGTSFTSCRLCSGSGAVRIP